MKLEVRGIHKQYANAGAPHTVLSDVSLTVGEGQYVTLLGPSGCGKTTLLNIVAGFIAADRGTIRVAEREVSKPGPDRGFIFQSYALFPWMSLADNVRYPMKRQGVPKDEREKRLDDLLSMARLDGKGHLYPHQLSGGMKQRTAVVRALAGRPQVLLMDEPFGAVDFQMRLMMQEEMERLWLKNRTTVLMVTHDVQEAIYMSDRVIVMSGHGGRIMADLPIDLPRPRERRGEIYHQYEDQLIDLLQQAFVDGERP
ncbi:MAG: ABC transporter ATP-binding protein SaoA [Actinomycetota bacterium]|nr:MAG: NitT/TauT family transport system ATP-binding [Actinomycetota bacterium]MDO8950003.1 ABC transporter ATP-binding protein SaoA [Actinomycetota bacterium]MDP3630204.1 ABC transporter ATP-binding protein SaoA [Actinomycetota bacterium]